MSSFQEVLRVGVYRNVNSSSAITDWWVEDMRRTPSVCRSCAEVMHAVFIIAHLNGATEVGFHNCFSS